MEDIQVYNMGVDYDKYEMLLEKLGKNPEILNVIPLHRISLLKKLTFRILELELQRLFMTLWLHNL